MPDLLVEIMSNDTAAFLGMVFLAVFLLSRALMVPTFGTEAQAAKKLRKRVKEVIEPDDPTAPSLLRAAHLQDKSDFELFLDKLPGMASLERILLQAGKETPVYKVVMLSIMLALVTGSIAWFGQAGIWGTLIAGLISAMLPIWKLSLERDKRLEKFEEQLPDAIDVMGRALQAGHPFSDAMNLVAEEMKDPIAKEFHTTFSDMNYGMTPKRAFYNMLERVPSVSLMALVTAILIQRETGGNLAEVLGKIAGVIRDRFRFQRKVLSLSAEARLSAWILALIPFALAAIMMIASPQYLPMLKDDPQGRDLIIFGFGSIIAGVFWMRKLIRIKV
ncbi:MAG: type II secretion system F family protein [Gammaproteobacteria bacterium]